MQTKPIFVRKDIGLLLTYFLDLDICEILFDKYLIRKYTKLCFEWLKTFFPKLSTSCFFIDFTFWGLLTLTAISSNLESCDRAWDSFIWKFILSARGGWKSWTDSTFVVTGNHVRQKSEYGHFQNEKP